MNRCNTYQLECPYALPDINAPIPCVGNPEQCLAWRKKVATEKGPDKGKDDAEENLEEGDEDEFFA